MTGLTSNPTIFEKAVAKSTEYDDGDPKRWCTRACRGEELFFELALEDLPRAADLFLPVHERTARRRRLGVARGVAAARLRHRATIAEAKRLHAKAGKPNLFIKIPGTKEGSAGDRGVDLRRRQRQRDAAVLGRRLPGRRRRLHARAGAARRRRAVAGRALGRVGVHQPVGPGGRRQGPGRVCANRLGIAVARQAYRAYRELIASDRWQRLENVGARPQRLLFASTGTKDPRSPDTLYVEALAAPNTVNTHAQRDAARLRRPRRGRQPAGGGRRRLRQRCSARSRSAGFDVDALARQLQADGAKAFVHSWQDLLKSIDAKSKALA